MINSDLTDDERAELERTIRIHEPTLYVVSVFQVGCPCGWTSTVCDDGEAATDEFMEHSREEELLALASVVTHEETSPGRRSGAGSARRH